MNLFRIFLAIVDVAWESWFYSLFCRNSKKEHLFEITLPKSTFVGHLDLKFILQMGCVSLPTIEVTLYRAAKQKPRSEPSDVDRSIDFGTQLKLKTPSNEFLKSINAEVVCGPLDLGSHVDLSAQGGNIVMTSPALILSKARNFYLHIKAKSTGKSEGAGTGSGSVRGKAFLIRYVYQVNILLS